MEKKGSGRLTVIWVIAAVAVRIVYAVLGSQAITDPFGFFSHAVIQEQEREPLLTSGIAYAYTERLSDILQFIGNRIEMVGTYQVILLILWLILFFFGVKMLIGNTAALVSGTLLLLWPWGALEAEAAVECENYLMLYWSLMLLLLGIFQNRVKTSGWNRSNACELYLMLTGFGTGVVIAWNYMGLLLIPVIIYVLAHNHAVMKERVWLRDWNTAATESKQQMSLISQGFILLAGAILGIYATLMKYTGLTGYVLFEQFFWWLDQFHDFPARCQDISGKLLMVVAGAVAVGCVCQRLVGMIQRKMASKRAFRAAKEQEKEKPEEEKPEEERPEELLPKEQEKEKAEEEKFEEIKFIDNPLPLPPKPEIKEMNFDLDIDEDDDFDH